VCAFDVCHAFVYVFLTFDNLILVENWGSILNAIAILVLDFGFGFWILDFGFWILDFGFCIFDLYFDFDFDF